jgi:hypothetical protein
MRRIVCNWWLWMAAATVFAQPTTPNLEEPETIEYGQVAPQWLEMTRYEPDTSADAVILADLGFATLQWLGNKQVMAYTFHRRIKILSEAGLKATHFTLTYPSAQRHVTELKAATYGLNPTGEVVQFKVDRRELRDEPIDRRHRQFAFRFPLAKVGSVIEYRYTYYTNRLDILEPWIFQQKYPVLHSEFHLTLPATHNYQRVMQGDLRNVVMLEEPVQYQSQASSGSLNRPFSLGGSQDRQAINQLRPGTHQIYLLRHIPALEQVEFSPTDQRLLPGLRFQLTGALEGNAVQGVFRNWNQLNRYASRQLRRTKLRKRRNYFQQTAKRITRDETGPFNQAQAIYRWVQQTFAWDSTYDWRPERLDRVIEQQRGSSASLNLLAMSIMREAGIEVDPVLLSTRSHGPVQVVAANLGQFNHLIGSIRIGGTEWLFDVLSDLDELGVLPRQDLNQAGYKLDDQGGSWIRLQSQNQIVRFTYSRFTLNQEGLMTGDISVTHQAYSAALERERAHELTQNPEDYLRRVVLTGMEQTEVMDYAIENLETSGEPITVSCTLQTRDFAEKIDDLIIIQPMMTKQVAENPFSDEERAMPVDLTYPLRESHLLGLRIPDNYEVVQLPQPQRVMLPNDAGLFVYNVMEMGNILHISSCIFLNQTVFLPSEYQGIRTFFDYIVRKHSEDIVLKRKKQSE